MPPANAASLPPFQVLVEAHATAIARFLRGMVAADDVDDLLQETLLAALRAYPRFDGGNPRAWLLTIARNKAIDEHRSGSRRPERLSEPDSQPDTAVPTVDADSELWSAVARLPEKQRAAVVLRFAVDLRYREIGEAIGCSEAAARRSVHEAVKSLRKSVQPEVPR
jgi:RNA polymerase sigma factor (sigma-70 family)